MESFVIRPATPADAAELAQVYVESWNVGFVGLMPARELTPRLLARWSSDLTSPRHRWWAADSGGGLVGFAGIGPSRDPADPALGELDTIAVLPAWWRRGVGRALMAAALGGLREAGYAEAVLWTLADYPRGAGFYAAHGWSLDGATRDGGRQVRYHRALEPTLSSSHPHTI